MYYNAHNDFTWQSTVLLAPFLATDDDETVRRKFAVTATYLDIWLMRRVVNYIRVGYSSMSYTMWLLCRDIRRKPLAELVPILQQKLAEDEVTFAGQRGPRGARASPGAGAEPVQPPLHLTTCWRASHRGHRDGFAGRY